MTTDESTSSSESVGLSSSGLPLTSDQQKFININILTSPTFPDSIQTLIALLASENTGFAPVGSNPSFELSVHSNKIASQAKELSLIDSQGNVFSDIPFKLIKIPKEKTKLILTLSIPDNISTGLGQIKIDLSDNLALIGTINIIDLNTLSIDSINNGKPVINKVKAKKRRNTITLKIKGANFNDANTAVTVFPSNENISIEEISVSANGKKLTATITSNNRKLKKGIITVATESGVVSKKFKVKK